ncbi:cysteine desulfurase family protein [Flavobacterium capsici]|uniref:cysteine desulfurase n=1 Tax=Flavobacterium capsici TaxID=3075618 RepID=A0AA96EUA2_9FLAO|nr:MULTISPECIES: cysteine desulfurase family protein [unclassified Flavobacterium]WNM18381.1 cysteine desulfurase family protein [Flavobacterium sp. PMR2A8]WNM22432.1 cysteine desulfurase family protein [Flavobacterium sp. PMTSA4]
MQKIYLDNAATTPIRQEVIDEMVRVMQTEYGNPSSTHSIGRSSKAIVESSRKIIAKHLNCSAQEIIFTSSATEASNWILKSCVKDLGIKRIVSSKIEHHATLYTIQALENEFDVKVEYINILPNGNLDYTHLENLFASNDKTLVSLMHVNNEIGVVNDIKRIGDLCQQNNALFHCDTVQSIGKMVIDLQELNIDFLVSSAHKFHGPKGIGFAYINKKNVLQPLLFGGEQEKGWRAGTEAVHQIAGLSKALDLSFQNIENEAKYVLELKQYCWGKLKNNFPEIKENGENTFYNILNVLLPFTEEKTAMILFNLDIKGIAVSRGSACQSGSVKPSHVLAQMLRDDDLKKPSLRISFSHYNTKEEIDVFIKELKEI